MSEAHPNYSPAINVILCFFVYFQAWPEQFREDAFNLNTIDKSHVEQMLQPVIYPEDQPELPKQQAMRKVATHLADIEDLNVDRILKK